MLRQIHVCDRCGASAEKPEDVRELNLGRFQLGYVGDYYNRPGDQIKDTRLSWDKQFCKKCRDELGIKAEQDDRKDDYNVETPTLEDMIREMVCE